MLKSRLHFGSSTTAGPIRATRLLRCNRTTLSNSAANTAEYMKWQQSPNPEGLQRRARSDMAPVRVIHQSKYVLVAGRNRCNHFNSNQYLIASRCTGEAILIDASDDWPDDWVAFIGESGLKVKYIFFTHLHIDNVVNLAPFKAMLPDVNFAWNMADAKWIEWFPRACARYGRTDMVHSPLALGKGFGPNDLLLDCATNRSTSFIELGKLLLFYVHTPGHSMGHTILHVPQEKLLFTGDLLFYDAVGRIDIPFGCGELQAQSLRKLEEFPDNTVLFPGHGRLSTLGRERAFNRGLRRVYELLGAGKVRPCVGMNEASYF